MVAGHESIDCPAGTSCADFCRDSAWCLVRDLRSKLKHIGRPMVNLCSGAQNAAT